MREFIHGTNIINAKLSALNNDKAKLGGDDNKTPVKTLRIGKNIYAFVSGQSLRYWIRKALEPKWEMSPIIRKEKIAFTKADPMKYPDDDMFGYMRAEKIEVEEGSKKKVDVTRTRIGPFKSSAIVSIHETKLSEPFGSMSRGDGDPVPFVEQCYAGPMIWSFNIDVNNVGCFTNINRPGMRNVDDTLIKIYSENETENGELHLDKETRIKRILDVLNIIPTIFGGAKQTRYLTDVTPKIAILTMSDNGNPVFSNIDKGAEDTINTGQLEQIIDNVYLGFVSKIYVGWTKGFLTEIEEQEIYRIAKSDRGKKLLVVCKNINDTYKQFIGEIQEKL